MTTSYYKDMYNYLTMKHPNSKVYIISDHHFFHKNIIDYERPEFSSVYEMNEYMIDNHNKTVLNDDIVIFLGDFSFKKIEIEDTVKQMNGYKYLLLGNHDSNDLKKNYKKLGFEGIFTNPIKYQDNYLSHYSFRDKSLATDIHYKLLLKEFRHNPKGINYHGHEHGERDNSDKYFNVSCETLKYEPLFIGYTGDEKIEEEKPLFINTPIFLENLKKISREKNINPSLLLSDYIYATMLEINQEYADSCCINGSYPQYKKYGYISKFSDLDLSLIYNDNISRAKNFKALKNVTDNIYKNLLNIDNLNLNFERRFNNLCIFSYLYSNGYDISSTGALDANMIDFNFYKEEDFFRTTDISSIQKYLSKDYSNLTDTYHLPEFTANFLTRNGDIANLILQLMFQKGQDEKKETILKKINYLIKPMDLETDIYNENYENMLSRFLLRNIGFLSTLGRTKEIAHIKETNFDLVLKPLPQKLKDIIKEIVARENSTFNMVLNEIKETPNKSILDKSKGLVRKLK